MNVKKFEVKVWSRFTTTYYEVLDPLTQSYSRVNSLEALGEEVKYWAKKYQEQLLQEIDC